MKSAGMMGDGDGCEICGMTGGMDVIFVPVQVSSTSPPLLSDYADS